MVGGAIAPILSELLEFARTFNADETTYNDAGDELMDDVLLLIAAAVVDLANEEARAEPEPPKPLTWRQFLRQCRRTNVPMEEALGMTLATFEKLYKKLEEAPCWFPGRQGQRRRFVLIEGRVKLYMTLRFLKGAPWEDLEYLFNVCSGAHNAFFIKTINDIRTVLLNEQLTMPDDSAFAGEPRIKYDDAFRSNIARGFQSLGNDRRDGLGHAFDGVIGCVDGILIQIPAPRNHPEAYKCPSKGYHALAVQVVCDARGRIVYWYTLSPGSSHDSTAWKDTGMNTWAEEHPAGCFFGKVNMAAEDEPPRSVDAFMLGDTAYRACAGIVTPYTTTAAAKGGADAANFNNCLRSTKVRVEQTVGWVMRRYPRLKELRHPKTDDCRMVLEAAFLLHNFLIDTQNESLEQVENPNRAVWWPDRCTQENDEKIRTGQTQGTRTSAVSHWTHSKREELRQFLTREQIAVDANFQPA
jgi:hypothetical protein